MRSSYWFLRFLAQWIYILYGRGRIYDLANVPAEGPVLLACNHQSYFDPIIAAMPVRREAHFMARDTLFRQPQFRWLISYLNAFPVKRATADVGAIKESLRRLKKGGVLVTFPEGTRTRDGSVGQLHPGIVGIARRAKCPIVPTALDGAFEIWPRDQRLPGRARLWVRYGKPIRSERLAELDADAAAAHLTLVLRGLHNDLRQHVGRAPFVYEQGTRHEAQGTS